MRGSDLAYESVVLWFLRRMDENSRTPFGAYLILIVSDHRHLSESGKTVTPTGPQMKGSVLNTWVSFAILINA